MQRNKSTHKSNIGLSHMTPLRSRVNARNMHPRHISFSSSSFVTRHHDTGMTCTSSTFTATPRVGLQLFSTEAGNGTDQEEGEKHGELDDELEASQVVALITEERGVDVQVYTYEDVDAEKKDKLDGNSGMFLWEYVVVATGASERHLRAMASAIDNELKNRKYWAYDDYESKGPIIGGEYDNDGWYIVDGGNFIVHLFTEETRQRYQFDSLMRGEEVGNFWDVADDVDEDMFGMKDLYSEWDDEEDEDGDEDDVEWVFIGADDDDDEDDDTDDASDAKK
eukprot:TRINITY_DN2074_c0_g2_i1.p1 TRINITY_DN2074_c0_g2~~TRINITY_DN2074_c0_g2_i1.p1  ORF type:complete len:308 (-),score=88.03 TRINITY_DN2074_c0_g2_i1:74-913(-)